MPFFRIGLNNDNEARARSSAHTVFAMDSAMSKRIWSDVFHAQRDSGLSIEDSALGPQCQALRARASIKRSGLIRSKHTSVRKRYRETFRTQEMASLPLSAMTGANSFNAPLLTNADYLTPGGLHRPNDLSRQARRNQGKRVLIPMHDSPN